MLNGFNTFYMRNQTQATSKRSVCPSYGRFWCCSHSVESSQKSSFFKPHCSKYNNDIPQTGKQLVFMMPTLSSQPGFHSLSFTLSAFLVQRHKSKVQTLLPTQPLKTGGTVSCCTVANHTVANFRKRLINPLFPSNI